MNEPQRQERLRERQREWEEAWRVACERREKEPEKKTSPQVILPRITVTEYEFVYECNDHENTSNQSCDVYYEESYQVICRPVYTISDENIKKQTLSKRKQRLQNSETNACGTSKVFSSAKDESRSFVYTQTGNYNLHARVSNTENISGETVPVNTSGSLPDDDVDTKENDDKQVSALLTSYTSSGSSFEKLGSNEIRQANNTGTVVHAS